MKLSQEQKKRLSEELQFISKNINDNLDNTNLVAFYFSAAYGAFDRIMRVNYDDDILFAEEVLRIGYINIIEEAEGPNSPTIAKYGKEIISKVASNLNIIAEAIRKGDDIYSYLRNISVLSYALTGPGIYLLERGLLKLP